ncbi:DUF1611 domain-containing protein [Haloplanus pelagicus]|jgi:uncharacterized NAD-dependent epimerase/dehydratase family protein|uniref:DUF1611 domain-containing protein n=1 Tax=Haloplanus pelagicus TaxID=2949995 RepID=UPI00203EF479|nr:DUF1611 domain-containing protein [Haloplanus sp. HW8-1]
MRVAILAHEKFPDDAKTAAGVLRYGDQDVAAVLDRDTAGNRVHDYLPDVQDSPVVAGIEDVPGDIDRLIIGIAPIGGGLDESWRPDINGAIEQGADVVAGLHYFLSEDEQLSRLADEHGVELWDVRKPPANLGVADGTAREVDAEIVLTVGTDCSTGKMTTTWSLLEAARERGWDAAAVPTGQTGVMVEGSGTVVDRTISDFTAGAVERMVEERADHDYLFVEGQGSITHPAYSGVTLSILHGSMPDSLVLCHEAGRENIRKYESFPIPHPTEYVDLYERLTAPLHETDIVAGALNTRFIEGDDQAREAVEKYGAAIDAPATDPVRFDADEVLDAL